MIKHKILLAIGLVLLVATSIFLLIWLIPVALKKEEINGMYYCLTGIFGAISYGFILVALQKTKAVKMIFTFLIIIGIVNAVIGILYWVGII